MSKIFSYITKKRKILLVFLIIILIVFASSCSALRGKSGGIKQLIIHKGKVGLTMGFLQNAPPPKFYAAEEGEEDANFPVTIQLANQGAYDIKGGYLAVSIERDYMRFNNIWEMDTNYFQLGPSGERLLFSLEGKKQSNQMGESSIATTIIKSLPLDRLTEQHKTSILATACYRYKTEASAEVCIDTDPYNVRVDDKICVPSTLTLSGGQGAPIEITKIEQSTKISEGQYIRPQFIIHVQNTAGGIALSESKIEQACSSESLDYNDLNVLEISDISFSKFSYKRGHIECTPKQLKLKNNKGYFKCVLGQEHLTQESPPFATPLYIELGYGYSQTISTDVLLERVLFN